VFVTPVAFMRDSSTVDLGMILFTSLEERAPLVRATRLPQCEGPLD